MSPSYTCEKLALECNALVQILTNVNVMNNIHLFVLIQHGTTEIQTMVMHTRTMKKSGRKQDRI